MPDWLPGPPSDESEEPSDPRLRKPGSRGMPAEVIDTPENQPGQQGPPPDVSDEAADPHEAP